jgi:DNA invertase Pin-like site-specific DNA recombinase
MRRHGWCDVRRPRLDRGPPRPARETCGHFRPLKAARLGQNGTSAATAAARGSPGATGTRNARAPGLGPAKVYQEKVSGARTDRVELTKLLKRIEAGDMLIVTRLDRLARSTRDLLNILHSLADKGAKFGSLADPWCDTSTPQGELLVTVLAGFATFERHLIKARDRGVRFGRPRKLDQHQRQEALERLANGETLVDVARTFGVDPTTIGRLNGDR